MQSVKDFTGEDQGQMMSQSASRHPNVNFSWSRCPEFATVYLQHQHNLTLEYDALSTQIGVLFVNAQNSLEKSYPVPMAIALKNKVRGMI